jgi:hypothetical protein
MPRHVGYWLMNGLTPDIAEMTFVSSIGLLCCDAQDDINRPIYFASKSMLAFLRG